MDRLKIQDRANERRPHATVVSRRREEVGRLGIKLWRPKSLRRPPFPQRNELLPRPQESNGRRCSLPHDPDSGWTPYPLTCDHSKARDGPVVCALLRATVRNAYFFGVQNSGL